jgi:hypothetical protein
VQESGAATHSLFAFLFIKENFEKRMAPLNFQRQWQRWYEILKVRFQMPAGPQQAFANLYFSTLNSLGWAGLIAAYISFAHVGWLSSGMSSRYVEGYTGMAEEHLTEAENLLSTLPRWDGQVCTVYSPLSKRNENGSTIQAHIEAVRKGGLLVES